MDSRQVVDAHTRPGAPAPDRIIRPRELRELLGVGHATLHRMRHRGELPEPLRISRGAVGWRASTIAGWLDEREREARGDGD